MCVYVGLKKEVKEKDWSFFNLKIGEVLFLGHADGFASYLIQYEIWYLWENKIDIF